jgi:hypothetical protein
MGTLETAEEMIDNSDFERSGTVISDAEGELRCAKCVESTVDCSLKNPLGAA